MIAVVDDRWSPIDLNAGSNPIDCMLEPRSGKTQIQYALSRYLDIDGHNSRLNEAHFDRWIGILRCLHDEQWWGLVSLENHNFLEVLLTYNWWRW